MPFGKRQASGRAGATAPAPRAAEASVEDAPSHNVDEATLAKIGAWRNEEAGEKPPMRGNTANANLTMALIVRAVVIFVAIYYLVHILLTTGDIDRLVAAGIFAMVADYGRVLRKALRSSAG